MAKQSKQLREEVEMIRIVSTDIPANMTVYAGLTKIKGVSWAMSNALCNLLKIDKRKKISTLSDAEIKKIEEFLKNPPVPEWLMNRRKDPKTGESKHLVTTELDLRHEFDIRELKKMKCYRGIRHAMGLPVRGQRTKSHFRKGKTIGVVRKKLQPGKSKK